mgnify:FL=1
MTKPSIPDAHRRPEDTDPETGKHFTDWDDFFLVPDSKAGKMLKIDDLLDIIGNHIVKIIKKEPLPHNKFFEKHKDSMPYQDILVFLSSGTELDKGCRKIKQLLGNDVVIEPKNDNHKAKYGCFVLKSDMKEDHKKIVTDKTNHQQLGIERKIIFSTNVAEASVTIESLAIVIDTAQAQVGNYDNIQNIKTLKKQYIAKAQIKQRIGRVGRKQVGATYFAYSKKDYIEKTLNFRNPQIRAEDLSYRILQIISMETVDSFDNLIKITDDLLDSPHHKTVYNTLTKLVYLGCIDHDGYITNMGKMMSNFNKTPLEINKSLMYSCALGVRLTMIPVILLMGESNIRNVSDLLINYESNKLPNHLRKEYVGENDFVTMHNIFYKYYNYRQRIYNEINEKDEKNKEMIEELKHEKQGAIDKKPYDDKIEKLEETLENKKGKIEIMMMKFCDKNYLVRTKLEDAYKKLIDIGNPLKYGFMKILGNDQNYRNIIRRIRKDDTIKYKLPKHKISWRSLPVNTMTEHDVLSVSEKYKENLLTCLLVGGFMNIGVLDEKTNKYHHIETNNVLQVSNPNLQDYQKGINYELPKIKPKFILYANTTLIGMNQTINYIIGFDDPMKFYIPGLIYYLNNENKYTKQLKLKEKITYINLIIIRQINMILVNI